MPNAVRHGNGYFTDDSEYVVKKTHGEHVVVRGDGSYADFTSESEAHEAAEALANGDASDRDYDWHDVHD